jgi:hypothetical protein
MRHVHESGRAARHPCHYSSTRRWRAVALKPLDRRPCGFSLVGVGRSFAINSNRPVGVPVSAGTKRKPRGVKYGQADLRRALQR